MTETINVLLTIPFNEQVVAKLAAVSPQIAIHQRDARKPEEIADIIKDIDVLYTFSALPMPEDAPRLRWVQMHTAGVDNILDHPLYTNSEVMFTTTSGIHVVQMAEYVFGMILAFAHKIPQMLEDQKAAEWPEKKFERYRPNELYGATLGIIGYGSIGRQVAQIGQAFGMRVVAVKSDMRNLKLDRFILPNTGDPDGVIPDRYYPIKALKAFLTECDFVVVTLPLTDATHHLITAKALEAMKPSAVLINVARGDIIDEEALVHALHGGKIGGAALDVFNQEPLPADSPLWKLPNTIISPHISGNSLHYDERSADVFAENLRRFLAEKPLVNLVERGRDY